MFLGHSVCRVSVARTKRVATGRFAQVSFFASTASAPSPFAHIYESFSIVPIAYDFIN